MPVFLLVMLLVMNNGKTIHPTIQLMPDAQTCETIGKELTEEIIETSHTVHRVLYDCQSLVITTDQTKGG